MVIDLCAMLRVEAKRYFLAITILVVSVMASPVRASGTGEADTETWIEVDGKVYGCVPDNRGPVGGGEGYSRSVVTCKYSAVTIEQLIERLWSARPGETVYIAGNVVLDFTVLVEEENFVILIPGGVTLASNRGIGGSFGALL